MSVESARARLSQANDMPWHLSVDGYDVLDRNDVDRVTVRDTWGSDADADLIAHALTDLAAALDVIEAATAHAAIDGRRTDSEGEAEYNALMDALDAFEALP